MIASEPETRADLASLYLKDPIKAHGIVFPHEDKTAPFHKELIRLFHSSQPNVVALCFRGAGKSTVAEETIALMTASGCSRNAVIVGESFPRAVERLHALRRIFQDNEHLRYLFGTSTQDIEGDVWRETRIELVSGAVITALGQGQAIRGMKWRDARPDLVVVDDLENAENTATKESRRKLAQWYWSELVPALKWKDRRIRVLATPLHPESLAVSLSHHPDYRAINVPIVYQDQQGEDRSAWPSRFPLTAVDKIRSELVAAGKPETWAQEYMMAAIDPASRLFQAEHLRTTSRVRSWEPTFVAYDPARTKHKSSATTGIVAGSFVGKRLYIWEARAQRLSPSEIIADMFAMENRYEPIAIGVEKTGLEDFIAEPLRHEQLRRGRLLPIVDLKPPRGKERFIERLQPLMLAGDVLFAGERQDFAEAFDQFLSFPTGFVDVPNAMAYLLEMRAGSPVYEEAAEKHIYDDVIEPRGRIDLAIHAGAHGTAGVCHSYQGGTLYIYRDWLFSELPSAVAPAIVEEARLMSAQSPKVVVPPFHFETRNSFGLLYSLKSFHVDARKGGDPYRGRAFLRELLRSEIKGEPRVVLSRGATWTRRALFGGLAWLPGKPQIKDGLYLTLAEALESALAYASPGQIDQRQQMARTPDGISYPSALIHYS